MSNGKVTIEIPTEKFSYLNNVLASHKLTLRQVKMHDGVRDSLIEDVHKVKSIIETSVKKEA